jgi:hypothetical protein
MNRFYLIIPIILLALFGGAYWQHSRTADADARAKDDATAQAKTIADAQKAETERKAREDADLRAAARLAEEQKKEAEKRAKWDADNARIAEETTRYSAQVAALTQEQAALEKALADTRAQREKLTKENFETARAIELARIARRNAELEVQRMTEMVARKAGETSLLRSTP